jgi:hypothetical protein
MKTVTEILGGAQELLNISFDLQSCFEEKLNNQQRTFLHMLRCIEEHLPPLYRPYAGTGRKPYQYLPFLRSQWAKNFFQIATTTMLIDRLKADPNLRLLCGFAKVPGQASFSRAYGYLAGTDIQTETHDGLTKKTFNGKVVYHVCRDSTAINAREKAARKDEKTPAKAPKKRGGPPKTEGKQEKPSETEMQTTSDPCESVKKPDTKCSFCCKENSRGNISYWKGYKPRLDVSGCGYPVTACVTGANVHDGMLAIPMEKITGKKVTFLLASGVCRKSKFARKNR